MNFLIFLAALAVTMFVFEVLTAFENGFIRRRSLDGMVVQPGVPVERRPTALDAILVALWPERFDPNQARNMLDVVSLLRRAGYPYDTPGEFYAAAIKDFGLFLLVGGLLAGGLVVLDMAFAAPFIALIFVFLGLRRPYMRLRNLARKRQEGMLSNMLIALSVIETLISSGVSTEVALRSVTRLGGPFCNLMALLLAQNSIRTDLEAAVDIVKAHLPDPNMIEANLFLQDIRDSVRPQNPRPIGEPVKALHASIHRSVIEATETRAALVRQRSGLFGVLAVLGLVLALVLPYMGVAF